MKIEIEISDEAYEILKKTAEIREIPIADLINGRFDGYEEYARDHAKRDAHYTLITNAVIKQKAREVYHKHPLQEFYIDPPKNNKYKTIAWRTCPVQPDARLSPDPESSLHIGEYWYELRWYDDSKAIMPGFTHIKKRQTFYRKTLKALKKAINKEMGIQHYSVK